MGLLKAFLIENGKPTTGTKPELVQRVMEGDPDGLSAMAFFEKHCKQQEAAKQSGTMASMRSDERREERQVQDGGTDQSTETSISHAVSQSGDAARGGQHGGEDDRRGDLQRLAERERQLERELEQLRRENAELRSGSGHVTVKSTEGSHVAGTQTLGGGSSSQDGAVPTGQVNVHPVTIGGTMTEVQRQGSSGVREQGVLQLPEGAAVSHVDLASIGSSGGMMSQTGDVFSYQNMLSRANIVSVAELVSFYDGDKDKCDNWIRQVKFIKESYNLDDKLGKMLISIKLKGAALNWFHSKPELIMISFNDLLTQLKVFFGRKTSKLTTRLKFLDRKWHPGEAFRSYAHEKLILGNAVPIDDEIELVECVIRGIPDVAMRNQARIQRYQSMEVLLDAFEDVALPCGVGSGSKPNKVTSVSDKPTTNQREVSERRTVMVSARKCYICGSSDHFKRDCKNCYICKENGHKSNFCPKRKDNVQINTCANIEVARGKYVKYVKVGERRLEALVDTGSDITLLRESDYVKIGAPMMTEKIVKFKGMGSKVIETSGVCKTVVRIDGNEFDVNAHIVSDSLLRFEMLLGADFLRTVQTVIIGDDIKIKPITAISEQVVEEVPEIFEIDTDVLSEDFVAHVSDVQMRERVRSAIENYVPQAPKNVGVEMNIVLKDDEPVYQPARRLSVYERGIVDEQIREWLKEGIIRQSLSEYASPVVLVRKKNGSFRLCVDYRKVNKKICRDRYPLPLIDDQLDALQGARVFSTIDLRNGFIHVPIQDESRK